MAGLARLLLLILLLQGGAAFQAPNENASAVQLRRSLKGSSFIYPQWKDGRSKFRPGTFATLQIPYYGGLSDLETIVEHATNGSRNVVSSKLNFADFSYHELSFQVPSSPGDFNFHISTQGSSLPGSPFGFSVATADVAIQYCVGSWLQGNQFGIQGSAALSVLLVDKDNVTLENSYVPFTVTVLGNAAAISDVKMSLQGVYEMISFTPKIIGKWQLAVTSGIQQIIGSPFTFRITPANFSATASIVTWVNGNKVFKAGTQGAAMVILKDAYNNTLNASSGVEVMVDFNLEITPYLKTDTRTVPDPEFTTVADFETGTQYIYFVAKIAGRFYLHVETDAGVLKNSPLDFDILIGNMYVPACMAQFSPPTAQFQAGSQALVLVSLRDRYGTQLYNGSYDFTVSVNGKVGTSRYITDVNSTQTQPGYMRILFIATAAGTYNLEIGDGANYIKGSPFPYTVTAGDIYVPQCVAEWVEDIDTIEAGDQITARVLLMDPFNNNITDTTGRPGAFFMFTVQVFSYSGQNSIYKNLKVFPDPESGYVRVTLNAFTSGTNALIIGNGTTKIFNSPLNFTVVSGPISINDSFLEWPYKASDFQIDSPVHLLINKRDVYGNPVSAEDTFYLTLRASSSSANATTASRMLQDYIPDLPDNTSVPIPNTSGFANPDDGGIFPISDLNLSTPAPGQLLISYTATEGSYTLNVADANGTVKGSPFSYTTFSGIVDPTTANCSGAGFKAGTVGQAANFDIQLLDSNGDPAYEEGANVSARHTVRAFLTQGTVQLEASVTADTLLDGLYHVTYTPAMSGIYTMTVTWTYYVVCNGKTNIAAGPVVIAKTILGGEGILPKIPRGVQQQLFILLVDATDNPVQGQRKKITWSVTGGGSFEAQDVLDIGVGYSTAYTINEVGSFSISISYDNNPLPGTPIKVQVMADNYFPKAVDDTVWTWEEVPIKIDVLKNDVVSSGAKKLQGFYKTATYGSMILEGSIIRYTPRRGFSGSDLIIYIMADSSNQLAYGFVYIDVRTEPPEFTYWPENVLAVEGQPLSTLDAFNGFHVTYTNEADVLILSVESQHGSLYLPGDALQLWHDIGFQNNTDTTHRNISLSGNVNFINRALQDFLFISDDYYNGNDSLEFSITNMNGTGDRIRVPVQVQPFNNPPYVIAPTYVYKDTNGQLRALSGNTVAFKVNNPVSGITVGDPDEDDEGVTYEMEVTLETTDGSISIILPETSAETTEYREEGSFLWQPYYAATIGAGYFLVVAQAVRFRAASADANIAFNTITYNGTRDGEALNIIANDMGNFGCTQDCVNDYTVPLTATGQIIIFTKIPKSSGWAYNKQMRVFGSSIGSAGMVALFMLFLVCILGRRFTRNRKRAALQDFREIRDDETCDATRVYNPLWIPQARKTRKLVSVPNPLLVQQRQKELQQRLQEVEVEIEQLRIEALTKPTPAVETEAVAPAEAGTAGAGPEGEEHEENPMT